MDSIRGAGGNIAHLQEAGRLNAESNRAGKEAAGKTEPGPAHAMNLNESSWGEDSSNRNQYFGSDSGQSEQQEEDRVVSVEIQPNDIIPPPELLLKKRRRNPVEGILRTMTRNAKKLIPFSAGWEREYLNPNRILENGKKKHDHSTQNTTLRQR